MLSYLGSEALSQGLSVGARRQLTWWPWGTAAWVYSMVVLGGVTRLTRSGLSMTEWKFTGESRERELRWKFGYVDMHATGVYILTSTYEEV